MWKNQSLHGLHLHFAVPFPVPWMELIEMEFLRKGKQKGWAQQLQNAYEAEYMNWSSAVTFS